MRWESRIADPLLYRWQEPITSVSPGHEKAMQLLQWNEEMVTNEKKNQPELFACMW